MKTTLAFLFAAFTPMVLLAKPPLLSVSAAANTKETKEVRSGRTRLQILHMGGQVTVLESPDGKFHVELSEAQNLGEKSGFLSSSPKVEAILEEVGNRSLRLRVSAKGSRTPSLGAQTDGLLSVAPGLFSVSGNISIGGDVQIGDDSETESNLPLCSLRVWVPIAQLEHLSVISADGPINIENLRFTGNKEDHIVHTQTKNGRVTLRGVRNATSWGPMRGFAAVDGCSVQLVTMGYEQRVAQLFAE
jgi:hypothetical protein